MPRPVPWPRCRLSPSPTTARSARPASAASSSCRRRWARAARRSRRWLQLERDVLDRDAVAEAASEMLRGQRLGRHEGEVDGGRVNGDRIRSSPASPAGGRSERTRGCVGLTRPAALNCTVRILSPSLSYTYVYGTASEIHSSSAFVDGGGANGRRDERNCRDPRRGVAASASAARRGRRRARALRRAARRPACPCASYLRNHRLAGDEDVVEPAGRIDKREPRIHRDVQLAIVLESGGSQPADAALRVASRASTR